MTSVPNFLDFTINQDHSAWSALGICNDSALYKCTLNNNNNNNAVLRPTFIQKLYYKLSSIVTFTFIQIFDQNFVFFTEWRQSCRVCLI